MERVLKPSWLKPLILLISLLSCVQSTFATTVVMPSDDEMIIEARAIVRGRVLSVETGLDEQQNRIYTYITLRVQEVLKGQITERRIVLKEPGGLYGNRGTIVFGVPEFTSGENVLLYLDTWTDGSLRLHHMLLGKFSVVEDPSTGKLVAVRNAPEENGVQVVGQSSRGPITNRMELSAYTEMVRNRLAANLAAAQDFDAKAYINVPVLARPTAYVSSTKKGDLQAQYHLWNPPTRWFEPDTGQSIVFKTNTASAPSAQVENDVAAATNCWSTVPGCSLHVVDGGTTTGCGLFQVDGVNTISFNNCDGYFSGSGTCGAGILAVTSIAQIDPSQTKVVNGVTFYRALESNLTFNPFASCYFSDHCNLQEVITHEMGHALGLHHSWDSTFPGSASASDQVATMYWIAHFDGRCNSLKDDDINGITFVYPGSGGGPGPLTVVTSALSGGTVGTSYSQSLTASGGMSPYGWSVLAGLGALPTGLSLSAGGTISGTPSTAGTYNFTVKVTDAASAAAQKALSIIVTAAGTAAFDSQFVSQTVPTTLQPGQSFDVDVKFLNTGTQAWSGSIFYLSSQNPPLNSTWGGNAVTLGTFIANPGQQMDVSFTAFAPAAPGIYNFQWQLYKNDGTGFFGQPTTNVSINVGNVSSPPSPPTIGGPSSLPAVKGTLFSYTPTATGGTPPYSWQLAAGPLPAGLTFNANTGVIAGTPTVTGNFAVTVQVTDSKSQTAQKPLTITVTAPSVSPVDITTSTLPAATNGVAFSQQLVATGGKPPYTWTVTTGALPGGISLGAASGLISGTPSATGAFSFSVTATDSQSSAATRPLSITVVPSTLSIATVPALDGQKGSSFSYKLSATGGTPPYTWSVTSGAFPPGLNLGPADGLISGVPSVGGLFTFTVTVRDQASVGTTANVQITLIDPEAIPAVTKVKYKGGKKLIVTGDRVSPAAALMVDGNQMPAAPTDGSFVLKPIVLAPGSHEIRIANPGGVLSAPFVFTVD